jgi:hypothetical protein
MIAFDEARVGSRRRADPSRFGPVARGAGEQLASRLGWVVLDESSEPRQQTRPPHSCAGATHGLDCGAICTTLAPIKGAERLALRPLHACKMRANGSARSVG